MKKTEYDIDRDHKTRNAEVQIQLSLAHVRKVIQESYLLRAQAVAYWAGAVLLGSLAVKVWFL